MAGCARSILVKKKKIVEKKNELSVLKLTRFDGQNKWVLFIEKHTVFEYL
jgi:hypothetical protein